MGPFFILQLVVAGFHWAVAVAAVGGAISALTTRPDAFDVAERMSKFAWAALLCGGAVVLIVLPTIPIIPWVAIILTGIYWFDVRPQLKSLIEGTGGFY